MAHDSKLALITGASSGIGAATAKYLASQGYRVVLVGRRREALEAVAADIGVAAFVEPCDASDGDAVLAMARRVRDAHGVPDVIINKPIPLNQEEAMIIRKHPEQGAEILYLAESLHKYIPAVLHHHEWYNGKGYPHGLQGEEIHIYAQIVAIADTYDAMTSSRPYRKGCTRDEATAEIMKFRGLQFNPELTDIFLVALNDYKDDQDLFSPGGANETHHFFYTHNSSVVNNADSLRDAAAREHRFTKEKRSSTH